MFSKINNITYLTNQPLSSYCSFKVGGEAKFLILAHSIDALLDVLHICKSHSIKYKIIGGGSNLLFDDLGFNGAIIIYNDKSLKLSSSNLMVSSGVDLSELIQYSVNKNLGGFEFAIGVPAKLGGAIVNNLGAYENSISTYIQHITVLRKNKIVYLNQEECDFKYHSSIFQSNNDIILSASFNPPFQEAKISKTKMLNFFSKRTSSQPLEFANAGSIFKRTPNIIPAKLIDEAGLKGLTINGCQVSKKHSGFIINLGSATSKDILTLIKIIKYKIFEKYNINLELEIEYINY